MGGYCSKATDEICHGCGFTCQCMTCDLKDRCDCSCRFLVVLGMCLTALTCLLAIVAYRERRRFLWIWSGIYCLIALSMTVLTTLKGPDPHDPFGCSVPFALWVGSLFVATLSCYTTDYIRRGDGEQGITLHDKYIYDPR